MEEMDIQILKYRTLQGQFLQANNKIVSLEKALEAANDESHELRELGKADLCHIREECLSFSKEASVDLKNIVGLLQLRMFSKNNDRTRLLDGEFDFDERKVEELGVKGMMGELNSLAKRLPSVRSIYIKLFNNTINNASQKTLSILRNPLPTSIG